MYQQLLVQAEAARDANDVERRRALAKLRTELRRIQSRDYLPPPDRSTSTAPPAPG
ncbi:hypothetical protein ACFWBI_20240 [Streptomyces sp. NPDC059982]|uniref:hypothetical protein n=1 Tax=Streptomyces sp. NPDC059982 TaxID=3347024 RepID=UPI003674AB0C